MTLGDGPAARAGLGRACPSAVPARVGQVLRVCLREGPEAARRATSADVRLALEGAFETAASADDDHRHRRRRGRLAWMAAFAVAARREHRDGGARAAVSTRDAAARTGRDAPRHRHARHRPARGRLPSRPTAGRLCSSRRATGRRACGYGGWRRRPRSRWQVPRARPIPSGRPTAARSASSLGSALKRLDLGGGAPQTLAPVTSGQGATWNADGVILFAPTTISPLMRVSGHRGRGDSGDDARPAAVGPPRAVLSARRRQVPVLRDGRAGRRRDLPRRAGRARPDTIDTRRRQRGVSARRPRARGSSRGGGWLLWVRTGMLVAQQLDVEKAALIGEPLTLADGVATDGSSRSAVSVATAGLVTYRTGAGSQRQLTWFDRSGMARGTVGDPDATLCQPARVPRRPSRRGGPHGAGQYRRLAARRRSHEPTHV